jgi:SAM-dependent methyltransferase
MATNYDLIAGQYKKSKYHPWRLHIEHYTLFELLGDLRGKTVLDLACGEGFYTRFLRQAGAARAVGVDLSAGMIGLAREEEALRPLGIDYRVCDAKALELPERFDVVTAAYLLNYASSSEELLAMCRCIARHLKPGGRFVTVNNNPAQPREQFGEGTKYGFVKGGPAELFEGAPISITIFLDEGPLEIVNYQLSVATHDRALEAAGLRQVRWHTPKVSPAGVAEFGKDYWTNFLQHPPITFLEARRLPRAG